MWNSYPQIISYHDAKLDKYVVDTKAGKSDNDYDSREFLYNEKRNDIIRMKYVEQNMHVLEKEMRVFNRCNEFIRLELERKFQSLPDEKEERN